MLYKKISDAERQKIDEKQRCEISYNGYHQWEVIKQVEAGLKPIVLCTKCLEARPVPEIPIDKSL